MSPKDAARRLFRNRQGDLVTARATDNGRVVLTWRQSEPDAAATLIVSEEKAEAMVESGELTSESTINPYDAKPDFTPVPDITETEPLSKLNDEQAGDLGEVIRGGLALLERLEEEAEAELAERPEHEQALVDAYGKTSEELAAEAEAGYDPQQFKPRARRNSKGQFVKKETPR